MKSKIIYSDPNLIKSMGFLIINQISNFLKIIDLEENGEVVKIDEVRIDFNKDHRNEGLKKIPSFKKEYDLLSSFKLQESRLVMLATFLSHIKSFTEFRKNNHTIHIDGFRLKNLNYWSRYRYARLFDNFGEICSACSCDCEFCFLKVTTVMYPKKAMLSLSEARTREKYYDTEKKSGLPVGDAWPGEPFLHPNIDDAAHVFRFKLKDSDATKAGVDPLVEMVRSFIADFLDLGCFTHKGKRVQVDGFYFTNDPERR